VKPCLLWGRFRKICVWQRRVRLRKQLSFSNAAILQRHEDNCGTACKRSSIRATLNIGEIPQASGQIATSRSQQLTRGGSCEVESYSVLQGVALRLLRTPGASKPIKPVELSKKCTAHVKKMQALKALLVDLTLLLKRAAPTNEVTSVELRNETQAATESRPDGISCPSHR
jgi:hypothetical protein